MCFVQEVTPLFGQENVLYYTNYTATAHILERVLRQLSMDLQKKLTVTEG